MTAMTFGQLVEKQKLLDPSHDVVKAAEYVIQFGKHKGTNLSMLMEQQHSYCMWLINQEESKNKYFNETCHNIKILIDNQSAIEDGVIEQGVIDLGAENGYPNKKVEGNHPSSGNMMPPLLKVDGVELVAGKKAVMDFDEALHVHVDLAKDSDENGVYETMGNQADIANGLLMGKLSDLLAQVSVGDLSFEFGEADIDVWLKLVSELENHGIDAFVVITTKHSKDSNNQRIKKIIPNAKNLKALNGVLPNA